MSETAPEAVGSMQAKAKLYSALARLQADLPKIPKNKTADTGTFKYKYADLPSVVETILPRLGKLGLAFVAFPTLNSEGRFVLAYSLVHEAGAEMTGEYVLPDKASAQQIGSAITYARRYSLCAVTGIAADEDDDGAAAQQAYQYSSGRDRAPAGDAFDNAAPARPRQPANGNGQPRGQVSRPAAQPQAAESAEDTSLRAIDETAQEFANQAHEARVLADLEEIHRKAREAKKVTATVRNPSGGGTGKLAVYIDWRRKQLKDAEDALNELNDAAMAAGLSAADVDAHVQTVTGADLESATPAQLREAARALGRAAA